MRYHARDMAVVRAQRREDPDRAGVGDAVGRNRGERAARPLRAAASARALRRRSICRRSRRSTCGAKGRRAGASSRRGSPRRCKIALERGEQALLFLNRRGFAPLTLCRACGYRLACPNCDAWLVDHRFRRRLVCHHCGFSMPLPEQCPKCEATGSFVAGRSRRRAAGAGGGRAVSRTRASWCCPATWWTSVERLRAGARRRGGGPLRHRHRHPARRQGPSFPEAQSGRHRRCRSRPRQRRSARRRAHLPAAAPGGRPRRPRGGPRHRACCRRTSRSIR